MFFRKEPPPPSSTLEPKALHPFYPLEIEIVNFVANDKSVPYLLSLFLGGWAVILVLTWLSAAKFAPHLRALDKMVILWFILTGTIHLFFEGYFAYNHTRMGGALDLFGQLWKEYALSDSRYLTSDPFVLCMESITAVRYFLVFVSGCKLIWWTDMLGTAFLLYGLLDCGVASASIPTTGRGVPWSDIRRRPVLCHLLVRLLP